MHKKVIKIFLLLLFPGLTFAHQLASNVNFISGFYHPFSGLDHIVAALSVGLLGVKYSKFTSLIFASLFIIFISFGFYLGIIGISLLASKLIISLFLIVTGVLISITYGISASLAAIAISMFASFHGHLHSQDIIGLGSIFSAYFSGMLLATGLLTILGLYLGRYLFNHPQFYPLLRLVGSGIVSVGVLNLVR